MTDTERGLLQDVLDRPTDDGPRWKLANWWEEQGQGSRAEFVRVQCRIANLDHELLSNEDCESHDCPGCIERRLLWRRGRELLERYGQAWFGQLFSGWEYRLRAGVNFELYDGRDTTLHMRPRRGFVAEIRCSLTDWCGGLCEGCYSSDLQPSGAGHANWRRSECPSCHGAGRVGGYGPALVRKHPVERVALVDKRPIKTESVEVYTWSWPGRNRNLLAWELPQPVFDLLLPDPRCIEVRDGLVSTRRYPTEAAALAALSDAALLWAKKEQAP